MLPDLSSLGAEVLGSAAAEANSTLIGLLQVAQAAMNPRSVTRTFSRQFSKRYLARWNDKTGLKVGWFGCCRGGGGCGLVSSPHKRPAAQSKTNPSVEPLLSHTHTLPKQSKQNRRW